ncbi:hypothetical protein C2G38_2196286 [Gigaspora rosea]|uniref:Serine-threonine/tyrosine-protein kinase catalytic domain-containing protein n=1 Tax=Gigaspora rosea TaxID=44941 RepID=A0A397UXD8_9GLOM|nr:hypothetical protein C2G38_2196286 [Gigaspora rosea]
MSSLNVGGEQKTSEDWFIKKCILVIYCKNQSINGDLITYITDLELTINNDETDLKGGNYGVLPYVAPKVLNKKPFTKASDLYSFGIIMT